MGVVKAIVSLSSLSSNSNLRLCFSKEAPKTSRKLVRLLDCLSLFESGKRPKGGIVYLEDEEEAKEKMKTALDTDDIKKKADDNAKNAILKLLQPTITSVSPEYKLDIQFL